MQSTLLVLATEDSMDGDGRAAVENAGLTDAEMGGGEHGGEAQAAKPPTDAPISPEGHGPTQETSELPADCCVARSADVGEPQLIRQS